MKKEEMVCKCGGLFHFDCRVPMSAGVTFDHYTCGKCHRIKMVEKTERPQSLETEIKRGYGEA